MEMSKGCFDYIDVINLRLCEYSLALLYKIFSADQKFPWFSLIFFKE